MKISRLTHLCAVAHGLAMERGTLTPAERPEFSHHRMTYLNGTPVLDGTSMRDDQVDDAIELLERLVGTRRNVNTQAAVTEFMMAYGRFGSRWQDIAQQTAIGGTSVRRALTRLIEQGLVEYREEKTRGTGSLRKRYYWCGARPQLQEQGVHDDGVDLYAAGDHRGNDDSGIRHHGTAVQGLTCGCLYCRTAVEAWFIADSASRARRDGGTGLSAGLNARASRRIAEQQEFKDAMEAGLAAA